MNCANVAKVLTLMFELSGKIMTAFNVLKIFHILNHVMISFCVSFKENGAYLYSYQLCAMYDFVLFCRGILKELIFIHYVIFCHIMHDSDE